MPKEKTVRIKLSVHQQENGLWVMKRTSDATTTLPCIWPSKESAIHDLETIVKGLLIKGFTVIKPDGSEVKPV